MSRDNAQFITDRIIAELESGQIPWDKPWTGRSNGAIKHHSGEPYSLLNQMLLRKPGEYLTYKQALDEGGHVKKGEKGHTVIFWKMQPVKDEDNPGDKDAGKDKEPKFIPIMKTYTVFHIDQCEGISPKWAEKEDRPHADLVEAGEAVVSGYLGRSGVHLEHVAGDRAFYSPSRDTVQMPLREQFTDTAKYYSTLFHELTHSTGHPSRLHRFEVGVGSGTFGSESYSKEELVAELGASMMCNDLGIETDKSFRNNAAYIQSWIGALKNDKRLIISAAARADHAVDLIYGRTAAKQLELEREYRPVEATPEKMPEKAPVVVEAPVQAPVKKSFVEAVKDAEAKGRAKEPEQPDKKMSFIDRVKDAEARAKAQAEAKKADPERTHKPIGRGGR